MAGSFNLFRQYQKLALAALAIMAMLAFFVLPPVLQMGAGGGSSADPTVVSWKGGGLTETGLQRELITRRALNQFLMALRVAATGDERVQPPLPDSEAAVVETLVMAREAEANGIMVSDAVVNNFLSTWTGDMVSAGQIEGVIDQLRARVGITESDIFDGLRSLMLSRYLQEFAIRGVDFSGAPAGWQWDDFRRLEQGATVEVVPVIAEQLADEVPAPSAAALEIVYERYKNDLPRARSATPGFKEPARVRYDMLVAGADLFVAEMAKAVTEEEIGTFYEENKAADFAVPADEPRAPPATDAAAAPSAGEATPADDLEMPATVEQSAKPSAEKTNAADEPSATADPEPTRSPASTAPPAAAGPADAVPADAPLQDAVPAVEPAPAAADGPAGDSPQADVRQPGRSVFRSVAFLQGDQAAGETAETAPAASSEPAIPAAAADPGESAAASPPESGGAEGSAASAADPAGFKPLAEVREEIRLRLARGAAERKLGEIFDTIAGRIATYAEELDLAIALGNKPPVAPDLDSIATEFGLDGLRSDFVTAAEAVASGGIGTSFQLSYSERFGVRQQRWIDMVFTPEMARWRPLATRDVAGNRYFSWKTEERPEFTPPFSEVRAEVERVWRLIEARPLARKRAEQIAADATGKTLAESVATQEGFEAATVGPFTWLTRGTAPFGSAPMLSEPEGISMAGESLMKTVFSLEPGETAVAFNEPETVCYAIRLAALEPGEDTLRQRFVDAVADPRRLEAVAEADTRSVYARWLADVTRRQAVDWKRPPR